MSQSLCDRLKLCAALLIAGLFSDVTSRQGWRRIGAAFRLWWTDITTGDRVPQAEFEARMAVCQACPLYYNPLGTCGTPLRKDLHELGCWCRMEVKAKMRGAHCWIDQEGIDDVEFGWHKHGL